MPIIEYYSEEEEKELGCGATYEVHDDMLIFDPRLAHAINHLYNHIKVLIQTASSCAPMMDTQFEFLAANHPYLRDQVSSLLDEFPKKPLNYKKMDALRLTIIGRLVEETQALTEIAASMAWAVQHEEYVQVDEIDNSEVETIEHLEQSLAHIPFVDFHAAVDEMPSIVQVINV